MLDLTIWRSLALFLLLGSVAGVLAGVLLLWRPDWLARVGRWANRWVSTRQMARPLERQVDADHWLYRYSRAGGTLLLVGALYILFMFVVHLERPALLASLMQTHWLQPVLAELLLDALVLLFLAGAVLALLVSLFLLFRPSLLREFEVGANQRLSLRQQLKPLEMSHGNLDEYVFRHVQLAGVLLLCGSLYVLVMLAYWLGRQ